MYDSVPPPPGRPVLFLHVSGSGGTTLCRQAAKQPGERGKRVGPNINCQFSCKNPYDYLLYGMRPAADRVVQRCASGIMAAGCSQLETMMHERGFNVCGLMHTSCSFQPRVWAHNSCLIPHRRSSVRRKRCWTRQTAPTLQSASACSPRARAIRTRRARSLEAAASRRCARLLRACTADDRTSRAPPALTYADTRDRSADLPAL